MSVLEAHVSFGNQAPLGTALLATALACFVLDASHAKQATGPTPDPTPAYPGDASRGREIPAAQTRTPAIAPVSPESIEDRILAQLERRRARMGHPDLRSVAKTIVEEAQRHAIDPALVLAIIQVESGCHRRAVSRVGARGLMQVMPSTAAAIAKKMSLEWKGEDSLFDPQVNIKLGVAYLGELQRRYQDIRKALIAYNWGPTRVDRMLRRGKALPRTYVEIVWSTYESGRDSEVGRS